MTQIAAPKPVFDNVKEWPAQEPNPRVVMGNNRPPPEEMVVIEFNEALDAKEGFRAKFAALIEKGKAPPDCTDDDMAGRLGDFIKMASNAQGFIDEQRTAIKAPYLAATRAIDGVAKNMGDQLADVKLRAKAKLDIYMAEVARKAREEQARIQRELDELRRQAEEKAAADRRAAEAERQRLQAIEDAKAAAEAREAVAVEVAPVAEPEPVYVPAPVKVEAPVARGDLGARVGTKTVWRHEIEGVRKLPDAILTHPTVLEAIDKVIAGRIRGGERAIKGCRVWSEQVANVR